MDNLPRYQPSESVVTAKIDEGVALLQTQRNKFFKLNKVGAEIWALLTAGVENDMIVAEIASKYGVSIEIAAGDVEDLLHSLEAADLIAAE